MREQGGNGFSGEQGVMKRVCVTYDTGDGRLGGHFTEYSFCGLPGVEIVAMSDVNAENDEAFQRLKAQRRYTDWRQMIEQEHPDIVVFCSRLPEEHRLQIPFALDHGCHVLCEKPLAADLEQCDRLVEQARRCGRMVQVAHLARFAPVFDEMRRLVQTGAIGRPLSCLMRGKEDSRGGGEDMMVLGTHIFDYAVSVFGLPEEVFAEVRQEGAPIVASSTISVEEPVGRCAGDDIFARFRFAGGVNGIFESRRGMVSRGPCERMGIVITGTKGSLAVRYAGDRDLRFNKKFPWPVEDDASYVTIPVPAPREIPGSVPLDYEFYGMPANSPTHRYYGDNNRRAAWNLLQAIDGKEPLLSSAEDAVQSLEMILGVYRSSLEHRPVALPLVDRCHPLGEQA